MYVKIKLIKEKVKMFEGWFIQKIVPVDDIVPYPPYPNESSGLVEGQQGYYKYSLKDSAYPTLIIIDAIFDKYRQNYIPSGHYELALSDDRQFMILMQTKNPIAIIPVFKIEEDKEEIKNLQSDKEKKRLKKEAKKQKKQDLKYLRQGKSVPTRNQIYMEATIEYVRDGDYYLIKYEKDRIRAWGVIKR